MKQPPSKMISEMTSATFLCLCNDRNIAPQFFSIMDQSTATTIDGFAKLLEQIATAAINQRDYTYNLQWVMAIKSTMFVDWHKMASDHWNDYCRGRLRAMYAPDWLKEPEPQLLAAA